MHATHDQGIRRLIVGLWKIGLGRVDVGERMGISYAPLSDTSTVSCEELEWRWMGR